MTHLLTTIDPRLLGTFVAIAEAGSFARAAQRISRSEAAVSKQMKKLEFLAGHPPLFAKSGRRMRLTDRGEHLLIEAQRLLAAHQHTLTVLTGSSIGETIRFGVPEDYGNLITGAVAQFRQACPNVTLEIICQPSSSLVRLIDAGELDVAVVTRQPLPMSYEFLCWQPVEWVASPKSVALEGERVPLALFQPGCVGRSIALEAWAISGRPHWVAFSSPSITALIAMVRTGQAISPLPTCAIPPDLIALKPKHGVPPLPPLEITVVRRPSNSQAARALAEQLRQYAGRSKIDSCKFQLTRSQRAITLFRPNRVG